MKITLGTVLLLAVGAMAAFFVYNTTISPKAGENRQTINRVLFGGGGGAPTPDKSLPSPQSFSPEIQAKYLEMSKKYVSDPHYRDTLKKVLAYEKANPGSLFDTSSSMYATGRINYF